MKTLVATPDPDDEYQTLVNQYIDKHQHLMRSAYTAMTRAIRLGGLKCLQVEEGDF